MQIIHEKQSRIRSFDNPKQRSILTNRKGFGISKPNDSYRNKLQ
ncbi:hypothetical protein LEP1GSC130_2795 [Leptospira santarosai str. 200403458]|nr:hypothetical protein LEP1GSC130_2795 [Leptospira santarosai str. 200403458]